MMRQIWFPFAVVNVHLTFMVNAVSMEVTDRGVVRRDATTTPMSVPAATCSPNTFHWSLCNAHVISNLAGNGPDREHPHHEARFVGVSKANGEVLDLVIKVRDNSTYRSYNQNQGRGVTVTQGCIAGIPVKTNTKTTFRMAFMRTGTQQEVKLEHFLMTIMDFDAERGAPEREYAEFDTPVSQLTAGSAVRTANAGVPMRMESMERGTKEDNPTGFPLTELQRRRSVEVGYSNVAHWDVTLGHENGNNFGDRGYMIHGVTAACGYGWLDSSSCEYGGH